MYSLTVHLPEKKENELILKQKRKVENRGEKDNKSL